MARPPSETARSLYGAVGFAALAIILFIAFGAFQGRFTSGFEITVEADRTGLGLDAGASVSYRGVDVGRVESIDLDDNGGVKMRVKVFESSADTIPSNVTATVDSSTLFGPKTVELATADASGTDVLAAGAVVPATAVSPEINGLYDDVYAVLTAVDAGQLNAGLTALAQTLDGRGERIGQAGTQLREYVEVVNDHLPAIQADIRLGGDVAAAYDREAADLLGVAENSSSLSETLVEVRPTLETFLLSLTRTTGTADLLVKEVGDPLLAAMARLGPTLDVLGQFAPMLGCTIKGLNEDRKLIETVAGNKIAAVQSNLELTPGQRPYRTEDSMPKNLGGIGPHCYGLPVISGKEFPPPHYLFDDGTAAVWTEGTGDDLSVSLDSLFGANLGDLLGLGSTTGSADQP